MVFIYLTQGKWKSGVGGLLSSPVFVSPLSLSYFQTTKGYAVTTGNACVSQILFKLAMWNFFVPAHPLISEWNNIRMVKVWRVTYINDLQCFAGIPNGRAAILFKSEHTSHFKVAEVVWVRENIYVKKRYTPVFPRHKHPSVLLSMFQTSGFRSLDSQHRYSWGWCIVGRGRTAEAKFS